MSDWKTATVNGISVEKRYENNQWEFKATGLSGTFKSFAAVEQAVSQLGAPQLASFVKRQGITNVQSYSWWSSHPQKQEAWNRLSGETQTSTTSSTPTPSSNATSTGKPISNIDDLWSEYVQIEQEINKNPQIRDQLFEEAKQFGKSFYDKEMLFLDQQKQQSLSEIQESYRKDMEKIKFDNSLNDQEKEEAVANTTEQFLQAHENLNFSAEVAYRNASKEIKKASEDIAQVGAQKYVQRIMGNVEGNIASFDARAITTAMKKMREDAQGSYDLEQQQIAMKRQSLLSDLESKVGTEQAKMLLAQAEQEDSTLSNNNIQSTLKLASSGTAKTERQNTTLSGVSYNPSLSVKSSAPQTSNLQGSINSKYSAVQRQNQLMQENIKNTANIKTQDTQQKFDQSQFYANEQRNADAAAYMQSNIQNQPYYWSNGKLVIGQQAKGTGTSLNDQNVWQNQLKASTWRLY